LRSEKEMLDLILSYAYQHEDIRVVIMNGSRVNPNARRDPLQDYDVVYYVRDVAPYRRNLEIPKFFGEVMIMEMPEDMVDPPPENDGGYGYLMQFMDGNRIDLGFYPVSELSQHLADTLSLVLLDKDCLVQNLPPPSERGYLPEKPTEKLFDDCCIEFWWLVPYVAKGLWRGDLIYARHMLDTLLRGQLMKALTWYFGVKTGFQKPPGKLGKHFREVIGEDYWKMLEQTYADARLENNWNALFLMGNLFRRIAQTVADEFGYHYPIEEDINVSAFIRKIRDLPKDAQTL